MTLLVEEADVESRGADAIDDEGEGGTLLVVETALEAAAAVVLEVGVGTSSCVSSMTLLPVVSRTN